MNIGIWLYTKIFCSLIGIDEFGNKYYEQHLFIKKNQNRKRYVRYSSNFPEATSISNLWFNWLHYRCNNIPSAQKLIAYEWEESNSPNLTGTPNAYYPSGHILGDGVQQPIEANYQAWKPDNN